MKNRYLRTALVALTAVILVPVIAFAAAPEPGKAIGDWGMAQLKPLALLAFAAAALFLAVKRSFAQLIGLALFAGITGLFLFQGDWVMTKGQDLAKLIFGG